MADALVPARLAFRDGTPYSEAFGDLYHSAEGGPGQARHVFLGGNGLPARWAGRRRFVILETGFGCGLNFLETWRAWRQDARRPGRLHFVSIEKHPFALDDLRALHERYEGLREEAASLHAAWPMLVPGAQRIELDRGRVVLTLLFADVARLRELRLAANAVYLDGFAPAKNPDMWSPAILRAVSRLCAKDATLATWSVAASVRSALAACGFATEKAPGFGAKREMLRGRLVRNGLEEKDPGNRKALVIGAGLAGAAMCERLCARGWQVTLLERHAAPAQEASGNLAGTFHPIMTPDDSVFARLTRAGFLHASQKLKSLDGVRWDPCGVLQLARDEKEARSQAAAMEALAPPPAYAQGVTREEASRHAGVALAAGGLWFPGAGWIQPRSFVEALLRACGERLTRRFSHEVQALEKDAVTVLCTGHDDLHRIPHARLRRVRGQVSYAPEGALEAPRVVVLRGGFVLPPIDETCVIGASFDIEDDDAAVRASSHAGNVERLSRILPGASLDPDRLEGRVGFRIVAPDRLPLAGAIAHDVHALLALGSRGLVWAPLAAELVASALEGEPLPLEAPLAAALDPGRFARRAAARAAAGSPGRPARPA
ncbi:MAG TPA: bifunctional tRNA (5-methylaminomethyl-2-thiouridine)(34)-methyltransferase MnmD/FAD-dependent 5-carboxymethylaminomethyl-2-thiouridine(34) oxidoreductase MnmC [Burkholderiales bacterium]|nr:bifunctional tRNA (5-methylaminomethyl-2-thiouridine)(34)-methyltransferase MnmD/FAD-dependent 5-carboxymethylaminomethyl-2-thiouridine(34) oxidoreductase MnmC [Burkholderiales bacterium]